MPSTVITKASFPNSLVLGIDRIILQEWKQADHVFPKFAKKFTPKDPKSDYAILGTNPTFGMVGTKVENAPTDMISTNEGYTITVRTTRYRGKIIISLQAADRDVNHALKPLRNYMPKAMANTREKIGWDWAMNNALTTSKTADQAYYGSASHYDYPGGPARSNLATGAAISYASIEAAIDAYLAVVDGGGNVLWGYPTELVVPTAARRVAHELMDSPYDPNDDSNRINVTNRYEKMQVKVVPWITGTVFAVCDPSQMDLRMWEREGPNSDQEYDKDAEAWSYYVGAEFGVFAETRKGIIFNAGAA